MRNYLAILAGKNSGEVGSKAEKVVLNNPKLRKKFLSHTKKHPSMVDSDGNPRLLFFFDDEELQRWLIRVVKGIFFYRNKRRISDKAIYSIEKHPEFRPPPSMTFPMEDGLELRPYFIYGIVQESSYDFWVLIFYDHLIFTVTVETPTSKN